MHEHDAFLALGQGAGHAAPTCQEVGDADAPATTANRAHGERDRSAQPTTGANKQAPAENARIESVPTRSAGQKRQSVDTSNKRESAMPDRNQKEVALSVLLKRWGKDENNPRYREIEISGLRLSAAVVNKWLLAAGYLTERDNATGTGKDKVPTEKGIAIGIIEASGGDKAKEPYKYAKYPLEREAQYRDIIYQLWKEQTGRKTGGDR